MLDVGFVHFQALQLRHAGLGEFAGQGIVESSADHPNAQAFSHQFAFSAFVGFFHAIPFRSQRR